jgi:hypothetical protein
MTELAMTRGDDVTFALPMLEDVSEARGIAFTVKRSTRDEDIEALIRKDLGAGVAVDGSDVNVTIASGDTRDLAAPVVFVWDLQVTDASGLTHTPAGGTLRIVDDVTREAGIVGSGSGSGS